VKQIVILSGKGGTGKTSVTAAFAHLAAEGDQSICAVLADADVDAANLELVLAPRQVLEGDEWKHEEHDFWGGQLAVIDPDACANCGVCAQICRFEAISEQNGIYVVDPIACDGCKACVYQCPEEAIHMEQQLAGHWFRSDSRYGPLFHAALLPAQENSGKLVTLVKQQARLLAMAEYPQGGEHSKSNEGQEAVIVDGPPGIGCPVIAASAGADLAVIVTEPTAAGIHDMARVLDTTDHFGIKALVCINKADLHPEGTQEIEAFCQERGVQIAGTIPFDTIVTEAMVQGEPVTVYRPESPVSQAIRSIWSRVMEALKDKE
jgi:MinD superfamily P-loop ATPase